MKIQISFGQRGARTWVSGFLDNALFTQVLVLKYNTATHHLPLISSWPLKYLGLKCQYASCIHNRCRSVPRQGVSYLTILSTRTHIYVGKEIESLPVHEWHFWHLLG